jgi:ubiquitin carboxyl-terminal hydrolase 8
MMIDQDQGGMAYVQYLRASEITVNTIPRHVDYRVAASQHTDWYEQFSELMLVSLLHGRRFCVLLRSSTGH